MKIINFRVSDEEHKLMHAIAEHDGLNLTAYIRRHFILQSRALGLAPDPYPQTVQAPKPAATPATKTLEDRLKAETAEFLRTNPTPPDDGLEYFVGRTTSGALGWIPRQPDDDSGPCPDE